jgi:hypothetical protein
MWRKKLIDVESLRFEGRYDKGHMGQEEVENYSVLDLENNVVGSVRYVQHKSIKKPFRSSYHLVQMDASGKVIFEDRWSDD